MWSDAAREASIAARSAHQSGVDQVGRSAMNQPPVKPGDTVSGLRVGEGIPNLSSLSSSLNNYEEHGVREIPLSLFQNQGQPRFASASEETRTRNLAEQIRQSGEIKPLIVVHDKQSAKEGPYVLEGGHRFDALKMLGKKSFPAHVVEDLD